MSRYDDVLNGKTVVASLRKNDADIIGWAKQNNKLVIIDRRTKWGNPFVMSTTMSREQACKEYATHFIRSYLKVSVGELKGKVLACWCYPAKCHGDLLAELANNSK